MTGIAPFILETTLNGRPAVIHVSDKTKERAPRRPRSRAWVAARAVGRGVLLVAAVAWAAGCCSYRVTCSNPYPKKTTLKNRLVKLRKVTFPHAWYQGRHQRARARHLADWLTSAFPDDPLVTQGYLRVDVEIISDHSLPESSDIEATVLTQGLWPTTLTTKSRETVILKFYDYDNRYLFEAATRQLVMTDSEYSSMTALGWIPRVFQRGWYSEATYLKKRMEILRDATLYLLDSPPTLRACVANAGALASIMPLYDRGDMRGPLGGDKGGAPVLGPVGQRWAVIVGVTDYKYAGVKGLENLR
ncbi:MAG: hypothetical protein HQ592_03980, partial [Planctomycetes bacterium]|nr:hypothetical protein [Planctomycetota bacterium]